MSLTETIALALQHDLDAVRAELEGVRARLTAAEAECDERRKEATEHRRLFELQHRRTQAAERLWREAHPGNDDVYPDLGELIGWMLGAMGKPTVAQDQNLTEGELARVRESLRGVKP